VILVAYEQDQQAHLEFPHSEARSPVNKSDGSGSSSVSGSLNVSQPNSGVFVPLIMLLLL